MSAAVFNTITGDDWKRSIAAARNHTNAVLAAARAKIAAKNLTPCPKVPTTSLTPRLTP